jgi:hypothetical protein
VGRSTRISAIDVSRAEDFEFGAVRSSGMARELWAEKTAQEGRLGPILKASDIGVIAYMQVRGQLGARPVQRLVEGGAFPRRLPL